MADDLIARLKAGLDEDERVALEAGERGRNWHAPDYDGDGRGAVEHDGEHYAPIVYDEGYPNEIERAHIARQDPARVLRWVKAAREVLIDYERAHVRCKEHPEDMASKGALLALHGVVRALASVYGDEGG